MGGIGSTVMGMATGKQAGMGIDLFNSFYKANQTKKAARRQMSMNNAQTAYNMKKRNNLLDQQLASRRAAFGGMGIVGSGSALAAQNRLIKEGYDDMDHMMKTNYLENNNLSKNAKFKANQQIISGFSGALDTINSEKQVR